MHEVLVNRLEGLSLTRKSVIRLTDRPDMTLDVHRGRKTTRQQQQQKHNNRFCDEYAPCHEKWPPWELMYSLTRVTVYAGQPEHTGP